MNLALPEHLEHFITQLMVADPDDPHCYRIHSECLKDIILFARHEGERVGESETLRKIREAERG